MTAFLFRGENTPVCTATQGEYFRIHIRANSDDAEEQLVKYAVRDEVVKLLTPIAATAENKAQAISLVQSVLPEVERIASSVLRQKGFSYGAKATVKREEFPTRVYGDERLPKGEYDALIVLLGEGKGQNWWCVVYPPLCFTGATGENVRYKSLILEKIEKWRNRG
ncbi:MAG: stage II sporulation protein R [Clostridia bacterium]|nr:stage II sporulation protein R [Clostridia bacterium]